MLKLTPDAYQAAKTFVLEQARPLDQARFLYHFEEGDQEAIWQELKAFQNPDGGFGHGLEPDVRSPASSVLATSIAFQILRETSAPMANPVLQGAIQYLVSAYNADKKRWALLPPAAQEEPRAPWWHGDEVSLAEGFSEFKANPRVELLGYLFDYALLAPHSLMEELVPTINAQIRELPETLEMHDLLCYTRLAETALLPHNMKHDLLPALEAIIAKQVARSAEEWAQYGLKPTMVVSSPSSPFASVLSDTLEANLDFEIQRQDKDGSWKPAWSWGELYPETWPKAKRDWSGKLTVDQLILLHKFARI